MRSEIFKKIAFFKTLCLFLRWSAGMRWENKLLFTFCLFSDELQCLPSAAELVEFPHCMKRIQVCTTSRYFESRFIGFISWNLKTFPWWNVEYRNIPNFFTRMTTCRLENVRKAVIIIICTGRIRCVRRLPVSGCNYIGAKVKAKRR